MQFHRLYCQVMRNTLEAQYVEGFCHCLDTSLCWGGRGDWKKNFVHVKRSITFIISCQFQTGLRILKTLFDLSVSIFFFFLSLGRRRIRTVCGLYLDVCDDTVRFLFLMSFPSAINQLCLRQSPPSEFQISSASYNGKWKEKKTLERYYKWISVPLYFSFFSFLLLFLNQIHMWKTCWSTDFFFSLCCGYFPPPPVTVFFTQQVSHVVLPL